MGLEGLSIAAKRGVIVYGKGLNENTPIRRGVCHFSEFTLYLVGTFQAGLNLYPYTRYMPRWHDYGDAIELWH